MIQNNPPQVTVLMPVYNAAPYLDNAIQSVLRQTFTDYEFLIINDGSTDNSLNIISKYAATDKRIRVISRSNMGLVRTLEQGVRKSRGAYIARMDADDVCELDRIQKQVDFLSLNPDYSVVGCRVTTIDAIGLEAQPDPRPVGDYSLKLFLGYGCAIGSPTMMIRKSILASKGGFRDEAWPAEDYDFLARLVTCTKGVKLHILPEYLYRYRENPGGISFSNRLAQAQKTKEIGDDYRKAMLNKGWVFLSLIRHREWLRDVSSLKTQPEKDRLMTVYYTVQTWFINDLNEISHPRAFLSKLRLMIYTVLLNPRDLSRLFNQPKSHSIPEV